MQEHEGNDLDPKREFYERLEEFSPDAQDFVALLSSTLLEPDQYDIYLKDKSKRQGVVDTLRNEHVADKDIRLVLRNFGLPIDALRREKRQINYQRKPQQQR